MAQELATFGASKYASESVGVSAESPQYSLGKILAIWASVALPMGLVYWVIAPTLIPRVNIEPGFLYLVMIALVLVWEGLVAFAIVRREVKPFTWQGIKDRLWLHRPAHPRTGARSSRLFLWLIPLVLVRVAFYTLEPLQPLNDLWVKAFPFLAPVPYAMIQNLAGPAVGQWWLMGVLMVMLAFNYLLGEELIFRGILLPKMNGVFGKYDFIANGILFTTYHLHLMWGWGADIFFDWIYAWSGKKFRSYWIPAALHGIDGLMLMVIFPMAILGMM